MALRSWNCPADYTTLIAAKPATVSSHIISNHQANCNEQVCLYSISVVHRYLGDSTRYIYNIETRCSSCFWSHHGWTWVAALFRRMSPPEAVLACGSVGMPSLSWDGLGCIPLCTRAASSPEHWTSSGQPTWPQPNRYSKIREGIPNIKPETRILHQPQPHKDRKRLPLQFHD
jgi:hypothetical protein